MHAKTPSALGLHSIKLLKRVFLFVRLLNTKFNPINQCTSVVFQLVANQAV